MAKGKRIELTTLERALSTDVMRAEAFEAATVHEIMRGLYDDLRWPMTFPGVVSRATATETPLRAHVLSGLLVRPDNNSYLLVDAGALLAAVPAVNDDDSILELVNDPGVVSGSSLLFVANAAGSVRLDIVEVSVVDTTLETATRGVFNAGTRNFDPTNVPKVKAPRLSYRIRQGTAGAGLPAMASGWLPLAVICHQPSTTSFADCDMWDVRPLIADRAPLGTRHLDPAGAVSKFEHRVEARWTSTIAEGVRGFASSQFNGYVAGGQLRQSGAVAIADIATDSVSLDLSLASNRDPAFALTANTLIHMVACFPGGLPRWVKYTGLGAAGVGGLRVPRGPRGILFVTNDQPMAGGQYAAVTPPSLSGFTADAPGVCLGSLMVNNAGTAATGSCDGRAVTLTSTNAPLSGKAGVGTSVVTWTFEAQAGVVVPKNAKTVDLTFLFSTTTFGSCKLTVKRATGDAEGIFAIYFPVIDDNGGGSGKITIRGVPLHVPNPWDADATGLPAQTFIRLDFQGTVSSADAYIAGYSL